MHRRERDRVGRRVPDVGVRLRVVVGSLVLEPVCERLVLLRRLGIEVDRLEVRDRLAELSELVEDELTAHRITRNCLLPHAERREKLEVDALDVVDAPSLSPVEVASLVQNGKGCRPVAACVDKVRVLPEGS
jgi:hypothetical protein